METVKFNLNGNKAQAMNRLHTFINGVVPELQKELEKGFKLNNEGKLFKRDKARLNDVIFYFVNKHNESVRAFISCNNYNISLECDTTYIDRAPDNNGYSSCSYYKRFIFLYDNTNKKTYKFIPLELINNSELDAIEKELEKCEIEYRELGYKISKLKLKLNC